MELFLTEINLAGFDLLPENCVRHAPRSHPEHASLVGVVEAEGPLCGAGEGRAGQGRGEGSGREEKDMSKRVSCVSNQCAQCPRPRTATVSVSVSVSACVCVSLCSVLTFSEHFHRGVISSESQAMEILVVWV